MDLETQLHGLVRLVRFELIALTLALVTVTSLLLLGLAAVAGGPVPAGKIWPPA